MPSFQEQQQNHKAYKKTQENKAYSMGKDKLIETIPAEALFIKSFQGIRWWSSG